MSSSPSSAPLSPVFNLSTGLPGSSSSLNNPEALSARHLLALPHIFQPINPALAAIHLARARTLLSLTCADVGSLWCHRCGGLREGVGGAARGGWRKQQASKLEDTPIPFEIDVNQTKEETTNDDEVKLERPPKRGRSAGKNRKRNRTGTAANHPGQIRTQQAARGRSTKRKPADCTVCGASFQRAKPDPMTRNAFPPARSTRRASKMMLETSPILPFPTQVLRSYTQNPPNPLSHPALNHIFSSPPNPPSEVQPNALARRAEDDKKSKPEPGNKRKKKSGLARLLAENKERSMQGGQEGMSWGFT